MAQDIFLKKEDDKGGLLYILGTHGTTLISYKDYPNGQVVKWYHRFAGQWNVDSLKKKGFTEAATELVSSVSNTLVEQLRIMKHQRSN